jgi:hypothetical protein
MKRNYGWGNSLPSTEKGRLPARGNSPNRGSANDEKKQSAIALLGKRKIGLSRRRRTA